MTGIGYIERGGRRIVGGGPCCDILISDEEEVKGDSFIGGWGTKLVIVGGDKHSSVGYNS